MDAIQNYRVGWVFREPDDDKRSQAWTSASMDKFNTSNVKVLLNGENTLREEEKGQPLQNYKSYKPRTKSIGILHNSGSYAYLSIPLTHFYRSG